MNNNTLIDAVARHENLSLLERPLALADFLFPFRSRLSSSQRVLKAMRHVDRKKFIPLDELHRHSAAIEKSASLSSSVPLLSVEDAIYLNIVLPIGYGQTCSQPSLVAYMTALLEMQPRMKVLEIGTGCGYQAAVLSEMVGPSGKVVTIETIAELAEKAKQNLRSHYNGNDGCIEERVKVITGDGSVGFPEESPYDAILVTAGVTLNPGRFDPGILGRQIIDGILVYPEQQGSLFEERYKEGRLERREKHGGVAFVPLQGKNA